MLKKRKKNAKRVQINLNVAFSSSISFVEENFIWIFFSFMI